MVAAVSGGLEVAVSGRLKQSGNIVATVSGGPKITSWQTRVQFL